MSQVSKLIVRIQQEGGEQLKKLETNLQNVGKQATSTNINFKQLNNELKTVYSQSSQSINSLRAFSAAFREVANNTDVTSQEFFEAKTQADLLDQRLAKLQQTNARVTQSFKQLGSSAKEAASQVRTSTGLIRDPLTGAYRGTPGVTQYGAPIGPRQAGGLRGMLRRGGGLGRFARTGGAIAAAGIFGGPEGALGAGIGGVLGGPLGAATGGAIGAQVSMLRQQLGVASEYAAALEKQRIALRLVTKESGEYQRALAFIDKTSRDFAIPQDIVTRQFTKLSASVLGAGGSVKEAEETFIGIAAGIRGTGGSLQDLDSALTATAQVFSKGKVSAEELRQQIGERLPGAFTLFAESLGITPQELDKALEKGQVSLQDFLSFSQKLFKEYGDAASAIATSPAAAGDRLQTALSRLSESVGNLLRPIGAAFQTEFTKIIELIDKAARKLSSFLGLDKGRAGEIEKLQKNIATNEAVLRRQEAAAARGTAGAQNNVEMLEKRLTSLRSQLKALQATEKAASELRSDKPKGLPGIDPSTTATGRKPTDISKELLALSQQRNEALSEGQRIQAIQADFLFREQQVREQLAANLITERKAEELSGNNRLRREQEIGRLFKGYGNDLIKSIDSQKTLKRQVEDQAIALGVITEKEAEVLLAKRELADLDAFKDITDPAVLEILDKIKAKLQDVAKGAQDFGKDFNDAFQAGIESMGNLAGNLGGALANAFGSASDALADFITTGKASFADFAKTVLQDLARIFVRFAMFNALKGIFQGTGFMGFANGGIMTEDGPLALKRYARGGIANSPQLAMFGEGSTPEAYVPLPDGRSIPVSMQNGAGGSTNVTVNVDAKGTQAQGDDSRANALGKAVSSAVQAEIIRQRRPGGLLA